MPPDYSFHPLLRDARPLGSKLVFHHHRRGRRLAGSHVGLRLVCFPGLGNGLHLKSVFLPQPGHDLVQPLSGEAAGIVHKYPDFEHGVFSFTALIFAHRNHAVENLLRRQIIHQPQVRAFLAPAVQKDHCGHALDRVLAQ